MTDEELVQFFMKCCCYDFCPPDFNDHDNKCSNDCKSCFSQWLCKETQFKTTSTVPIKPKKRFSNGDKTRAMSLNELTNLFVTPFAGEFEPAIGCPVVPNGTWCGKYSNCEKCFLKWFKHKASDKKKNQKLWEFKRGIITKFKWEKENYTYRVKNFVRKKVRKLKREQEPTDEQSLRKRLVKARRKRQIKWIVKIGFAVSVLIATIVAIISLIRKVTH